MIGDNKGAAREEALELGLQIAGWDVNKVHTMAEIRSQLERETQLVLSGELSKDVQGDLTVLHEDELRAAERTATPTDLDAAARAGVDSLKAFLRGDSTQATRLRGNDTLRLINEATKRMNKENKRIKTGDLSPEEAWAQIKQRFTE